MESFGRKKYSFLKQQYEQMMPKPLQPHPNVCSFYTVCAAFQLLEIWQKELMGVHDVNVLSFIGKYKVIFDFSKLNVKVTQGVRYFVYTLINLI